MKDLFILLIIFQLKHFLADYPLQGKYMLGKFKDKGWILPLGAHCLVHALFTYIIAICYTTQTISIIAAVADFIIHFAMDRVKASPKMLGRFTAMTKGQMLNIVAVREHNKNKEYGKDIIRSNVFFWWSLGLDQMVHHLTHYGLIALILFGG